MKSFSLRWASRSPVTAVASSTPVVQLVTLRAACSVMTIWPGKPSVQSNNSRRRSPHKSDLTIDMFHTFHFPTSQVWPSISCNTWAMSANCSLLDQMHFRGPWLRRSNGADPLLSLQCRGFGRNLRSVWRRRLLQSQASCRASPDGQRAMAGPTQWRNRITQIHLWCTTSPTSSFSSALNSN